MGPAAEKITVLHFNDVYNIEERTEEPVGGAARMKTALKQYTDRNPLILFSGDALAPSILSTFTKGEQMIPVLNKFGTHCAVYGNHDFDFGIDTLLETVSKMDFPWLMSNVTDNETGRPLADGKITHIFDWWGRKIGLIGLVECEWLDTLSTINPEEVTYTDYVTAGTMLTKELKEVKKCEVVIALTHMRTHNDIRLAENVPDIDLILGGHDHVYEKKKVNGTYILKSGTDFRNFSVVTLDFSGENGLQVDIASVDVTKEFEPDPELASLLDKYKDKMDAEMCKELGEFEVDLDGRFSSIRTMETNLGTFVCDIMVAATNADFALLNSGTLRSDMVHPAGPFFLKDLLLILPMIDPIVLLELTGPQVIACLENGVSKWPALEGRFPQVSGINFAFDPSKPPGQRVNPKLVKIGDEYIDMGSDDDKKPGQEQPRTYRMATKSYLMKGKDGYDCLVDAKVLIDEEEGPQLTYAVQNHFKALSMKEGKTRKSSVHHQSLVTMSRKSLKVNPEGSLNSRHSLIKQLTDDGSHHLPAHIPESLRESPIVSQTIKPKLGKQATISDLEQTKLAPKVEGRIRKLDPQVQLQAVA